MLTDKPRVEEFSEDNRIIDRKLREHTEQLARKANTVPPAVYSLVLSGGFTNTNGRQSIYMRTQESLVVVDLYIQKTDGKIPKASNIVAQLPLDFRPAGRRHSTGFAVGSDFAIRLYADPNGNVFVSPPVECDNVFGQITFLAVQ